MLWKTCEKDGILGRAVVLLQFEETRALKLALIVENIILLLFLLPDCLLHQQVML